MALVNIQEDLLDEIEWCRCSIISDHKDLADWEKTNNAGMANFFRGTIAAKKQMLGTFETLYKRYFKSFSEDRELLEKIQEKYPI